VPGVEVAWQPGQDAEAFRAGGPDDSLPKTCT